MELEVILKELKLTKRLQPKVYDLIEECRKASCLCEEVWTCSQVEVYLKLCDVMPSFICQNTIKEEQNPL